MLLDRIKSLFRPKVETCSYALLWEDESISWARYSQKGGILAEGVGDWEATIASSNYRVADIQVVAAGRKTFYGMSKSALSSVDAEIPFEKGRYQIRTVTVPRLDADSEGLFYAVASDSLISEISKRLGDAGLTMSSLEVPATVLARRSERLKGIAQGVLQIHIGYKYTQFLVSSKGYPYVAREIGFGFNDLLNQYSTHLRIPSHQAARELQTLSVVGAGPVEPAVVKLLDQSSRTLKLFSGEVEAVSVIGPGWLRGIESRFSDHLGVHPLFADGSGRNRASLLSEVAL